MNIQELAQQVDQAALNAKAIEQLSKTTPFDEAQAYEIQAASLQMRYERGEKLVGLKMGFTSKAKMEQMGVHDLIWGRLTNAMLFQDKDDLDLSKFIHPRAEAEICFKVKRKITKELKRSELDQYIMGVAAAVEIIDSRYENFKFSLEDVIADNCSSAGFIVGQWYRPDFPINKLAIKLRINGKVVHEGSSADILGDPWDSLLAATRLAAKYNQPIPAGSYIMAGAATPAVYLEKDNYVRVEVEDLGKVSFSVS